MNEAVIAVIFDFDGTLGPDTIASLLDAHKISPKTFWTEVDRRVDEGWDPPLAYMQLLWEYAKDGKLDVSKKTLRALGKKLELFPGLPKAFTELKEFVKKQPELNDARVSLEFYIISGGIEEIILGNKISGYIDGIFGSNFVYDSSGKSPVGIKSAISFTEKTRFLYGINKGVSVRDLRSNPYKINDATAPENYRIPFPQMIYIGDGPSDIPCLSAVSKYGGTGIGVSSPANSFRKGYELARGKRITVGPYTANYQKDSDMRKVLQETILRIGLEIAINKKKHLVKAPGMGS
jgi:2-hydroxy-3-keto-5-methylthiopentenyl-1-phosphate phosphatase